MEAIPLLDKKKIKNAWSRANAISKLLFWYIFPILKQGNAGILQLEDVHINLEEDESNRLGDELERAFASGNAKSSRKPLFIALKKIYLVPYIYLILILLIRDGFLRSGQAILLGNFIRSFSPDENYPAAAIYGISLILTTVIFVLIFQHSIFMSVRLAMKMRIAVSTLVYRKTLRLTQAEIYSIGAGKITNMLSSDVGLFDYGIQYTPFLFVGPISTILSAMVIWSYVGKASLPGFGIALLLIPFQVFCYKFFGALRSKCASFTDARLRLITEVLNGILLIKMSTWEEPFLNLVTSARASEVNVLRRRALLNGFVISLLQVTPKITLFVVLLIYVIQGNILDAETAFVISNLFSGIATMMATFLPYSVINGAELLTSIQRIDKFLASEETSHHYSNFIKSGIKPPPGTLTLDSVYASWGSGKMHNGLRDISLGLRPGNFVAVIGSVGAGKTALLLTILQEMKIDSGHISVQGGLAYAPQTPCLFSGTVRENILYGSPYNSEWYAQVVEACALTHDFKIFPHADKTLVGEKGVTLSGGQKSRIGLARAVYHNADIYLLDDPLSSVDAIVGSHLLDKCLRGVLKSKAILLVTHLTSFCRDADKIFVMEHGEIVARGSYIDLTKIGYITETTTDKVDAIITEDASSETPKWLTVEDQALVNIEYRAKGRVEMRLVLKYLCFGNGSGVVALTIILAFLNQALLSGSDVFLKYWTSESYQATNAESRNQYLLYYSVLMVPLILMPFARSFAHYCTCLKSAEMLHAKIFRAVIKSPMRFFEITPVGIILNRFSKDMRTADDTLPQIVFQVSGLALQVMYTLALVSWMNPILILPALVLLIANYNVRQFYLKSASTVARLEATAKSPVFGHMSSSIHGLTTIRAYGVQDQFKSKFDNLQNRHTSASFTQCVASRWLGTTSQIIFTFYFATVVMTFVFYSAADASTVGFAVPITMFISTAIASSLSQSAEMENQLVSIERIFEYTELEPEQMDVTTVYTSRRYSPPENWPLQGTIVFKNVKISYIPGVDVLRGISCLISPAEKIGVVGRTGAGKTSLVSALFRLVNLSSGSIRIDDVDISSLDVTLLRSKIAIIPQQPILFAGTLRKNLDPFSEFDDSTLYNALSETQLDRRLGGENGLETEVGDNGANFSQGQRQLISVSRALLRKCRILVLDEATAHVDSTTDKLIQTLVKEKFSSCTVITIAHRLETVLDSDRVCVMESGEIAEFDSPIHLLANHDSRLFKLANSEKRKS